MPSSCIPSVLECKDPRTEDTTKQKHTKKFRLPIWLSLQHLESTYEDSNGGQEVFLGFININFPVMEVNLVTRSLLQEE